jgi:hypothetical protein
MVKLPLSGINLWYVGPNGEWLDRRPLPAGVTSLADERRKRAEAVKAAAKARQKAIADLGFELLMYGGSRPTTNGLVKTCFAVLGPQSIEDINVGLDAAMDLYLLERQLIFERFGVANWIWHDGEILETG